jgi:redox-sensitive bicupin YhaK (pirin superfamily)
MDTHTTRPADTHAVTAPRRVERLVQGQATSDGAGVKLVRVLTQDLQRRLDPFLMLDAFGTDNPGDYIGGFPDHPHRGFETVTYMLQGRMRHRDSVGNVGLLAPGSVQWMTAGRGVIHSEMPEQEDGAMEGFQLWLNLPSHSKMREPWYRDIAPGEVPVWQGDGATVKVIAGSSHGVAGAVQREQTEPLYLDVQLAPGARFEQLLPDSHNAFLYVYRGELTVADTLVRRQRMAILANTPGSHGVVLQAGPEGAQAILIAGRPLKEPIAQYGPFVMNTQQELVQAVQDFQAGRLA